MIAPTPVAAPTFVTSSLVVLRPWTPPSGSTSPVSVSVRELTICVTCAPKLAERPSVKRISWKESCSSPAPFSLPGRRTLVTRPVTIASANCAGSTTRASKRSPRWLTSVEIGFKSSTRITVSAGM
jgi:hypothetical protein